MITAYIHIEILNNFTEEIFGEATEEARTSERRPAYSSDKEVFR